MTVAEAFSSADWWELRGRGWVASIAGIPGLDPRPLVGQQVRIDGKPYIVKGVETFRAMSAIGQPFGLLVGDR